MKLWLPVEFMLANPARCIDGFGIQPWLDSNPQWHNLRRSEWLKLESQSRNFKPSHLELEWQQSVLFVSNALKSYSVGICAYFPASSISGESDRTYGSDINLRCRTISAGPENPHFTSSSSNRLSGLTPGTVITWRGVTGTTSS